VDTRDRLAEGLPWPHAQICLRPRRPADEAAQLWAQWGDRLATYVGPDYPLAVRVGAAAGQALNAAYGPAHAYEFGLARVIDALDRLIRG